MATVFYAVHKENQQELALKILHEHYADDPHISKRLEHEARIVMRLKHPYVVPVLDYEEFDARPYPVMPYFPGGVRRIISENPVLSSSWLLLWITPTPRPLATNPPDSANSEEGNGNGGSGGGRPCEHPCTLCASSPG